MLALANRMSLLGTETAFEVLARAKALEAEGRSIINLGIGQPDFPTPGHIVEAGRKALADGHHGYTPANGILPLREAVSADLHRRYKVEISPAQVLVRSRPCNGGGDRQRPPHATVGCRSQAYSRDGRPRAPCGRPRRYGPGSESPADRCRD